MRYSQYIPYDTANGEGIRVSLWPSGCTLNCKGCFNKAAQNFINGIEYTPEVHDQILFDVCKEYIQGISILGGHMFEEGNYIILLELIKDIKSYYSNKDVYVWTGYTLDIIKSKYKESLKYIDVLIDGPFIESKKCINNLIGSSNQRILYKNIHF